MIWRGCTFQVDHCEIWRILKLTNIIIIGTCSQFLSRAIFSFLRQKSLSMNRWKTITGAFENARLFARVSSHQRRIGGESVRSLGIRSFLGILGCKPSGIGEKNYRDTCLEIGFSARGEAEGRGARKKLPSDRDAGKRDRKTSKKQGVGGRWRRCRGGFQAVPPAR